MAVVEMQCVNPECPTFVKALLEQEPDLVAEFIGAAIRAAQAQSQIDRSLTSGTQVLGSLEALRRRMLTTVMAAADEAKDARQVFCASVRKATRYQPAEFVQDPVCPECGMHDFQELGPADSHTYGLGED